MKKVLFIAVIAVASLASCTKDHTCTCTSVSSSGTTTTDVITYFKSSKKNAKLFCQMQSTQDVQTAGGVTVTGSKTTCTLK